MDFIRKNNPAVSEISEKVLEFYQKELLPVESFEEFCDVAGNLCVIQSKKV